MRILAYVNGGLFPCILKTSIRPETCGAIRRSSAASLRRRCARRSSSARASSAGTLGRTLGSSKRPSHSTRSLIRRATRSSSMSPTSAIRTRCSRGAPAHTRAQQSTTTSPALRTPTRAHTTSSTLGTPQPRSVSPLDLQRRVTSRAARRTSSPSSATAPCRAARRSRD